MYKLFMIILTGFIVLFFSCEQAEDPLSTNFSDQQIDPLYKTGSAAQNNKTAVAGQFSLTNIVTWGDQYANPGDRYFVNGLVADFVTNGSLPGSGQLEQYARYDQDFTGPTHGSFNWIIEWNGEQILLSGRFQGKSYPGDGVNMLETNSVLYGTCSTGPVILKSTIIGPSLGPFQYSGTLITP